MDSSDFISSEATSREPAFERIDAVESNGLTCDCFIVRIDGKSYFMKKLKDEFAGNPTYRSLLKKEFETGTAINHPNLTQYVSLNDDDSGYYILMENIVGETLDRFIVSHPDYFKSRRNLDRFFNQLLGVMNSLHESRVVYSDLKPQNIMVTQVNSDVKLIDLGFCYTDAYTNTAGTTKEFSAPEQTIAGKLDVATDIYGIGGIIRYIGENQAHNLPNVYSKIMMRCLKVRQQDRPQSTDEILRQINRRKHTLRRVVILGVTAVVLFIGWKALSYNEEFIAWWDSFELFPPSVDYDGEFEDSYYRVVSEEERTCMAVGQSNLPNVYLHEDVTINGRQYRLTEIGDSAFCNKTYIKSAYLPEGILKIGRYAFYNCKKLAVVELPNSVEQIEDYSFYGCNNVHHIKLSPRIRCIPKAAFSGCGMKKIVVPEGVEEIRLDAFGNCVSLEEVELPETLRRIERGVFWCCGALKRIDIPAQVDYIGEFAFYGCNSLRDIYNYAEEPQIIPPIHHNPSQITLHVPAQSVQKYRRADYWGNMNVIAIE